MPRDPYETLGVPRSASEATLDLRGLPAGPYVLRGAGRAQHLAVE